MQSAQTIQQCIQTCQQISAQLRNMANTEPDPMAKNKLIEGAHHLALCIEECNFSLQQIQSGMA
ncbi:hypothetical protein P378_01530 [Desulforamulus profundi]|uniref:Uncharacterized protein n=2 Tax=Desulforamulus TaxID=2916693 RepID=A0A2C6MIT4_9FIRM|nr:hypothetical protein P378_01530 [Desulforamulus profundi]SHE51319.1 hypothetical protein SAMN02745133_00569 [Desulforamulus putei DSM 12395]